MNIVDASFLITIHHHHIVAKMMCSLFDISKTCSMIDVFPLNIFSHYIRIDLLF
jgi:hypothetical protein